ncbi:helix-turn-helix domain-containing protein [Streptacidiphilus sp. PB12-B1b]|uniref:helix-turn-helix domain-containing protein n=1 Tax=Streptacidiphilus sp. PB12-B1b TaxID=2705012 RepID=UPI0015FA5728|nr:helix-turn-helix transcriptional regulator [Streptacidiphilus sp. PB12-B1b]QMU79825.1 helix-turn-helix domain-containing protein [Streptacidiphilus sp. PB12-B1b]
MTAEDVAFGARVAAYRRERDKSQAELAAEIGRTASWLSQVERGIQPVNRLPVLRMLADALGVSRATLRPDLPELDAPSSAIADEVKPNDLDQARLLLSGHPVPEVLLSDQTGSNRASLPELRAAVDRIWDLTHADKFAELSASLGPLIPRLERAARTAPAKDRPELWQLLGRTYQALAAAFVRQDEPDAAWVAADRSISAAERSGQPLQVFAGIYRLSQAFVRLKRLDQAEHAATTAVNALHQYTEVDGEPEALSVLGALHLQLATVHAKAGDRAKARDEIGLARAVARRIGEDRNDFNLEFGPTNVEIQAVASAVELGDAGEAIDISQGIDASGLSVERRARLLMDLGRAYAQRRQPGEALEYLLQAEELAPEMVSTHIAARETIRELMLVAGRSASPELRGLAERADAKP